jgi:hypothetical protein
MSEEKRWRTVQFSLDRETDEALDTLAAEVAQILGLSSPNRSRVIREMVQTFDTQAWAETYFRARREPQAA